MDRKQERSPAAATLIVTVCSAQLTAQIGGFMVAALLPTLIDQWKLTHTQAGWILGIYNGGYTLAVPLLVSLTDRVDARRVYLLGVGLSTLAMLGFWGVANGFWTAFILHAMMGVGWAGTYMPGLKTLSDRLTGRMKSRAVSMHVAAVSIGSALSYFITGLVSSLVPWRWVFVVGASGTLTAFLLMLLLVPPRAMPQVGQHRAMLLDFRPVFRNRSALGYSLGYCIHSWEMFALRQWIVAFLTFSALHSDTATGWLTPSVAASLLSLFGSVSSILGNEVAIRLGRSRFITGIMAVSLVTALCVGFAAGRSYSLAAALCLIYGAVIWADSSALTAGSLGSARAGQEGATIAVHSTLGYGGGFLGPLAFGLVLDVAGGDTWWAWSLAFGHLALVSILGIAVLLWLRPRPIPGDQAPAHVVERAT